MQPYYVTGFVDSYKYLEIPMYLKYSIHYDFDNIWNSLYTNLQSFMACSSVDNSSLNMPVAEID